MGNDMSQLAYCGLNCADCVEYPCIDLKELLELVPVAKQNLEKLR